MNIRYPIYEGVYRILTMQPGNGIYQISRKQDRVSGEKRQNHSICTGFEKGIENEKEQFPQNVMI